MNYLYCSLMKFVAYTSISKCSLILNSEICKFIWKSFHNFINQGLINLCRCCLCMKLDTRQPGVCLLPLALVDTLSAPYQSEERYPAGRVAYYMRCVCTLLSASHTAQLNISQPSFMVDDNFIIWCLPRYHQPR